PADRHHGEAHPAEQQSDPDDDAEERYFIGHVARVERGREGGLLDPHLAGGIFLWLSARRLQRLGFVVGSLSVGGGVARHLRVVLAARGLKRVDVHVLREAARTRARVDRLIGDRAGGDRQRR